MILQRQTMIWIGVTFLCLILLWLLSGILLPFVAGLALAYFLDPLADRLEALGLSRLSAVTIISIVSLIGFVAVAIVIFPLLYQQTVAFIEVAPEIGRGARALLVEASKGKLANLFGESAEIKKAMSGVTGGGLSWVLSYLPTIGTQGLAFIGLLSLIFITPVVAFYLLLDWDNMVDRINELLPADHAEVIRSLATEINEVLSGFLRGQGLLCLFLGVFYAAGLTLVGLRFGLVIGIVTGILSFVPYLGSIVGFVGSVAIACFQFWPEYRMIAVVIAVFVMGQFIEGNILQPKLIGKKVRLHPVWVMFSILAFGTLFGFVGALLALPLAAAIGVIARFAIARYERSKLHLGKYADLGAPVISPQDGPDV
ncbi:MAG: AI-2E family transporter [Parvibaculum sp.]|nr:AI-2E family transporter [Parvibaculum sp.]